MKAEIAQIVANGKPQEIKLPCSLAGFLRSFGWQPTQVVVEHNGRVVAREDAGRISLDSGDRIEIIVPVAGG